MPRKNDPFLGLGYGWNPGENGWGTDGYNQLVFVLSLLSAGNVEAIQQTPPLTPDATLAYIVGTGGTGDWYEKDNHIAYRYGDTWQFIPPKHGMLLLVKNRGASGEYFRFSTLNEWVKLETGGGGGGIPDVDTARPHIRTKGFWYELYGVITLGGGGTYRYSFPTPAYGVHGGFETAIQSDTPFKEIEFILRHYSGGIVQVNFNVVGICSGVITPNLIQLNGAGVNTPTTIGSDAVFVRLSVNNGGWFASVYNFKRNTGEIDKLLYTVDLKKPYNKDLRTVEFTTPNALIACVMTNNGGVSGGATTQTYTLVPAMQTDGSSRNVIVTRNKQTSVTKVSWPIINMESDSYDADPATFNVIPANSDGRIRAVLDGAWVDITDRLSPPK